MPINSFFPEFQKSFNPTQPWQQALVILLRLAFNYSKRKVSTGELTEDGKKAYEKEIADWREYFKRSRINPQQKQDLRSEKLEGIHRLFYGKGSRYLQYELKDFFEFNNNELGFQITQLFINLFQSATLEEFEESLNSFFNFNNLSFYKYYPCSSLDANINRQLQDYLNKTENNDQDEDAPCSSSQASQQNNEGKEQWAIISTINLLPLLSSIQSTLTSSKINCEALKEFIEKIKSDQTIILPFAHFTQNNGVVNNKKSAQSSFDYFKSNTLRYFGIGEQPNVKEIPCVFTEFFDYFAKKEKFEASKGFYQEKFFERLDQFLLLIQLFELLYEESCGFAGVQFALKEFKKYNQITTHGLTANKRYERLFEALINMNESDLYWHYHQWNQNGVKQEQRKILSKWKDQYNTAIKTNITPELSIKDKAISIILMCFENNDMHLERIISNNFFKTSKSEFHPLSFISYALRVENVLKDTELKKTYLFLLHYLVDTKQLIKYCDFQDDDGNNILHYMIYAQTSAFHTFLTVLKETVDGNNSNFEKTQLFQLLTQQNKQGNTPLHLCLAPKSLRKDIDNVATHVGSSSSQQQEIYDPQVNVNDNSRKHTYYNFITTVNNFIPAKYCFQCLSIPNNLDKATALHLLICNPDSTVRYVSLASNEISPSTLDWISSLLTVEEILQFQQMKAHVPNPENYFLSSCSFFDYRKADLYVNAFFTLFFGTGLLVHGLYYASDPEYRKITKCALGGKYTPVDLVCDEKGKRSVLEVFNQHTVFNELFNYIKKRNIDLNKSPQLINPSEATSSIFASGKKKTKTHDYVPDLIRFIDEYVYDEDAGHQKFQESLQYNYINPISEIGYLKSDLLPILETIKSMDRELIVRRFNEIKPRLDELHSQDVSEESVFSDDPFAYNDGLSDNQL